MEWNRTTKVEVQDFVTRMNSDQRFYDENINQILEPQTSDVYKTIHDRLKIKYVECKTKVENGQYSGYRSPEYGMDLEMGYETMVVLHDYGFSPRDAADDEIWLYMNRYVVPDIIFDRFVKRGLESRPKLVPDRFYENNRRYYLKMLWWYYYISWQEVSDDWYECLEVTTTILRGNQSNDISQLIERAGSGYPLAVYKEIMRQYAERVSTGNFVEDTLSKVLKLNIVYMQSIEPELVPGGVQAYVRGLFIEVCDRDGRAVRRPVFLFLHQDASDARQALSHRAHPGRLYRLQLLPGQRGGSLRPRGGCR